MTRAGLTNGELTTPFWKLLHAIYGAEAGRDCRDCGAAMDPKDAFGLSEGVCRACRAAGD